MNWPYNFCEALKQFPRKVSFIQTRSELPYTRNFSRRACSIFPFPIKGKRYQMKTRQRKLSISKPVIEFVYRERGDLCWKRVEGPDSEKSIDSMLFMKCLKGKFQQIYSISIHSYNDFRLIFQRITTQSQSRLEINTREVPMGKYFSDLAATEVLLTRFSWLPMYPRE